MEEHTEPEREPEEEPADGASDESPAAETLPALPTDDDGELGDTDQHSDA
jgi:hypothetical protein